MKKETLVGCLIAIAAVLLGSGGGCLIAQYVPGGTEELAPLVYAITGALFGLLGWLLILLLLRARQSRWAFYGAVLLLLLIAFWVIMHYAFP